MKGGSLGLIGTVAAREDTQPRSQVDGAADLSDPLPGTRTSDRDRSLNSPGATILFFTSLTPFGPVDVSSKEWVLTTQSAVR